METKWQRRMLSGLLLIVVLAGGFALLAVAGRSAARGSVAAAAADTVIYADSLATGWEDWSWDAATNPSATGHVHGGAASYAVTYTQPYAGFYLHSDTPVSTAGYTHLRFWVYGTGSGERLVVLINGTTQILSGVTPPDGTWLKVEAPLSLLGGAAINDIYWQDESGAAGAAFFLDDIALVDIPPPATTPDPTPDRQLTLSKGPSGVAIAPSGRIYVAAWRENRVYSWPSAASAAGAPDLVFGTGSYGHNADDGCLGISPTDDNLCGPESVTVDAANNLYVADTYFGRVQIYRNPDTEPAASKTIADASITSNDVPLGLSAPRGVDIDTAGNLWLADVLNNRVLKFVNPLGTDAVPDLVLGQSALDAAETFFNHPLGVVVDGGGNVYVADLWNDRVLRFDAPVGNTATPNAFYFGVSRPHDLAIDPGGSLYVSSPKVDTANAEKVIVFHTPLSDTTADYDGFTGLDNPMGLAFDSSGALYVANCGNPYPCDGASEVQVFNAATGPSPTATPTATPVPPTPTPTPSPTPNSQPAPGGDAFETDDACAQARPVTTDGQIQPRTIHRAGDIDWARLDVSAGVEYQINVEIPQGSPADIGLEVYATCEGQPNAEQNVAFSPGVRLKYAAPATGVLFLRMSNADAAAGGPGAAYQLAVRSLQPPGEDGALILVAGRYRQPDTLQPNIHNVTSRVYRLFQENGYAADDIYYLATDATLPGYDAPATLANLQSAITTWARPRVGPKGALTIYLMDHGGTGEFYLDRVNSQVLTPQLLNTWLSQLEATDPGVPINVIIEACQSGSFITNPGVISKPGRVVITSANAADRAFATASGAIFSDQLVPSLQLGSSLGAAFEKASSAATAAFTEQVPWIDANGNGVPKEPADVDLAAQRGFLIAGTFAPDDQLWEPYIAVAAADGSGAISARVTDDKGASRVWALVYPPGYVPPGTNNEYVEEGNLPSVELVDQGEGIYAASYSGFDAAGEYRLVFRSQDGDGLEAKPVVVTVSTVSNSLYLPAIRR